LAHLWLLFQKTIAMKKNRTLIPALVLSVGLGFAACNGDHSTHVEGDTLKNSAGKQGAASLDSVAPLDTSKHTSTTGDASTMDNSASGGTKIAKDSSKIKKH
jgi:ABC-type oligopeptide transport system substrate-binding subunit